MTTHREGTIVPTLPQILGDAVRRLEAQRALLGDIEAMLYGASQAIAASSRALPACPAEPGELNQRLAHSRVGAFVTTGSDLIHRLLAEHDQLLADIHRNRDLLLAMNPHVDHDILNQPNPYVPPVRSRELPPLATPHPSDRAPGPRRAPQAAQDQMCSTGGVARCFVGGEAEPAGSSRSGVTLCSARSWGE